jgi:hypothetical protein
MLNENKPSEKTKTKKKSECAEGAFQKKNGTKKKKKNVEEKKNGDADGKQIKALNNGVGKKKVKKKSSAQAANSTNQGLSTSNHSAEKERTKSKKPLNRRISNHRPLSISNHSANRSDHGGLESISENKTVKGGRGVPGRGFGAGRGTGMGNRAVSLAHLGRPDRRLAGSDSLSKSGGGLKRSGHSKGSLVRKSSSSILRSPSNHIVKSDSETLEGRSTHSEKTALSRQNSRAEMMAKQKSTRSSRLQHQRSQAFRMKLDGSLDGLDFGKSRPSVAQERSQRQSLGTFLGSKSASEDRMSKSGHSRGLTSLSTSTSGYNEFPDDNRLTKFLRYISILPPVENEKRIHQRQRHFIWASLFLDFIAAMVAILSYDEVTKCCGDPIFQFAATINWNDFIQYMTYIYLSLIFAEIFPVFRKGLPFNLLNPLVGFTITFCMFFDDAISEAVIMWAIEATAILFEVLVYRLKNIEFRQHEDRIKQCSSEIEFRRQKSKARVGSMVDDESVTSFGEEEDNHELDDFRVQRERRRLKESQKTEAIYLRYHLIGNVINVGLVVISLSLIIGIAKNGGLCIYNMEFPNPFSSAQLQLCNKCEIWDYSTGPCEMCDSDLDRNNHQCYYPYS